MIENYNEFRTINKYFLRISIIRQVQQKNVEFNKTELFSAIKYLTNKELKQLLLDFYGYDSDSKGKFKISDSNKEWLISKVLINVVDNYIKSKRAFNKFEQYLENIILLLSLTNLVDEEINNILDVFKKIINKASNTIGIYQSINLFLSNQYNLYKPKINEKKLLNLITTVITKFVYRQYGGYDFHAITRGEISNLYGYAKIRNAILKDEQLIDKLISECKELPIEEQLNISQSLLLNIYDISTEPIKNKLKNYILNIKSNKTKEKHDYLIFELTLIIRDFKQLDDKIIKELSEYFEQFKDSRTFSFIWYTLDSQIDYLIKEKKLIKLEPISKAIKTLIENYKNSERLSII